MKFGPNIHLVLGLNIGGALGFYLVQSHPTDSKAVAQSAHLNYAEM